MASYTAVHKMAQLVYTPISVKYLNTVYLFIGVSSLSYILPSGSPLPHLRSRTGLQAWCRPSITCVVRSIVQSTVQSMVQSTVQSMVHSLAFTPTPLHVQDRRRRCDKGYVICHSYFGPGDFDPKSLVRPPIFWSRKLITLLCWKSVPRALGCKSSFVWLVLHMPSV